MERGVMNVSSSTILKMYAGVTGAAWSTPLKRKAVHEQEPGIKTVYINSVNFKSNHSKIKVNLKISPNKAAIMCQIR